MVSLEQLYKYFISCDNLTTDSRKAGPGMMYLALKGERFDGNKFACQAIQSGSPYAVVDDPIVASQDRKRMLLVADTLVSLQQLAHHHRMQFDIPVIGITGTNGKTTTKELIAAVLSSCYSVLYTQGNFNNHIGVPLTLLQLRSNHQIAIVEMGANHLGEIASLVEIVSPTEGLITNVGEAHLEGFGSLQGVIDTKTALYRYLSGHQADAVYVDSHNELLTPYIPKDVKVFSYVRGTLISNDPMITMKWSLPRKNQGESFLQCKVKMQLIGKYNLQNILAAITIGLAHNITASNINKSLAAYTPTNNRSQFIQGVKNNLILDAYNANPTSMKAALENFDLVTIEHKVVILGDMRELGDSSLCEHLKIIEQLCTMKLDEIYLVGTQFDEVFHLKETQVLLKGNRNANIWHSFLDKKILINFFTSHPLTNKTILIKGSNGIGLSALKSLFLRVSIL